MRILRVSGVLAAPRERLFAVLEDPRVQDSLHPPFLRVEVLEAPWLPRPGARTRLRLVHHGVAAALVTELVEYRRGALLRERQVEGPFRSFEHALSLEDEGEGVRLTEVLAYELAFGPLGRLFDALALRRDLLTVLHTRRTRLGELFSLRGD